MKKNVKRFLFVLLPAFIFGCADVYKGEDSGLKEKEVIPPGETYTPESKYNLNVVYYVPADDEERADWHYRLSGVTLHVQKFFTENMQRYKINKKFGLVLNDENPEFVKIHFIKSKRIAAEMQEKDMGAMSQEVLEYFTANPKERTSNNFLVFMPEYTGAFYNCSYPEENVSLAFCGCDNDKYRISYFESQRARAKFLPTLGRVLYETGRAFFLTGNSHKKTEPFLSLMGINDHNSSVMLDPYTYNYKSYCGYYSSSLYAGTPDKIRLTESDAKQLGTLQLFQEKEFTPTPLEITIEEMKIACLKDSTAIENDTIFVTCRFRSPDEVLGVVMYNDPWMMYKNKYPAPALDEDPFFDTGVDASSIYTDRLFFKDLGNSTYEFSCKMAMCEQIIAYKSTCRNSEIRFRFIGKGGRQYPQSPDVKGAMDSKLRYPYTVTWVATVNFKAIYIHDIATRYGVKE